MSEWDKARNEIERLHAKADGIEQRMDAWSEEAREAAAKARGGGGGGGAKSNPAKSKEHHAEGNRLTKLANNYKERGDHKLAARTMAAAKEQYGKAEKLK